MEVSSKSALEAMEEALSKGSVLKKIFSFFSYPELLQFRRVSKTWREYATPLVKANVPGVRLNYSRANVCENSGTIEMRLNEFIGFVEGHRKNIEMLPFTKLYLGDNKLGPYEPKKYANLLTAMSPILTSLLVRSEVKANDILLLKFPRESYHELKTINILIYPCKKFVQLNLQGFIPVLAYATKLESISIINLGSISVWKRLVPSLMVLQEPKRLRSLELTGPLGQSEFETLLMVGLELSSLKLTFSANIWCAALTTFLMSQENSLKELELALSSYDAPEVTIAIPKLSNLVKLTINGLNERLWFDFPDTLKESFPSLVELSFTPVWTKEIIDKFFPCEVKTDTVTVVTLDTLPNSKDLLFKVLKSFPGLIELKLKNVTTTLHLMHICSFLMYLSGNELRVVHFIGLQSLFEKLHEDVQSDINSRFSIKF